ncbi:MAG TPA: helix-turn-helix domain-containing protein [Conexibacter sp.]|nr:helix-turn-helix domain-containing protein [Conexibacter sp.]
MSAPEHQRKPDVATPSSAPVDCFTQLVLDGAGVDELVDAVAAALDTGLLVLDPRLKLLAASTARQDAYERDVVRAGMVDERSHAALTSALTGAARMGAAAAVVLPAPAGARVVVPLLARSELIGALVVASAPTTSRLDRSLLARGAAGVALVLMQLLAEQRMRGDLVDDLLGGRADAESIARRARLFGLDLAQPLTVVVASPHPDRRRWALADGMRLVAEQGGLVGEVEDTLVFLLPARDGVAAGELVSRALGGGSAERPTVGSAGPAVGPGELLAAHADALATQRLLVALDRSGDVATALDLGLYTAIFREANRKELAHFVARTLGAVLDYRHERPIDLIGTLESYLDSGCQATKAARAIHVHVNTLYQRLERLDRLLGERWREPDRRLELHMAIRLHRLSERLEHARRPSARPPARRAGVAEPLPATAPRRSARRAAAARPGS